MTVTEWMYGAWNLQTEIRQLKDELRAEEEKATSTVAALDKPAVSSSKDPHKYERLADLSRMIEDSICRRLRIIADVQETIEGVQDSRCRILLRKRFIECKGWKRIANEMHYSERQIKRLTRIAIREITPFVEEKMSL